MKKAGRLVVALAGVGALIGFIYRGPLMEIADAFKDEINYYFSINPDDAMKGKIGNKDVNAVSNRVTGVEINGDAEAPNWDLENATGEVFDVFIDRLPFIKETGDWISENILRKEVNSPDSESSSEDSEASEKAEG